MTVEEFKIEVLPIKNKLYRLARRLMKNNQEAEDIVQEVFLKLWVRRNQLAEFRNIEAYAITMTKNQCLDQLKSKKDKTFSLNGFDQVASDKHPGEKMEINETINQVRSVIDTLPELQKMVIHLRDIEGLEFEEIAEVLHINVNAIRVNLSRARKKVRDEILKLQRYEFSEN